MLSGSQEPLWVYISHQAVSQAMIARPKKDLRKGGGETCLSVSRAVIGMSYMCNLYPTSQPVERRDGDRPIVCGMNSVSN